MINFCLLLIGFICYGVLFDLGFFFFVFEVLKLRFFVFKYIYVKNVLIVLVIIEYLY